MLKQLVTRVPPGVWRSSIIQWWFRRNVITVCSVAGGVSEPDIPSNSCLMSSSLVKRSLASFISNSSLISYTENTSKCLNISRRTWYITR